VIEKLRKYATSDDACERLYAAKCEYTPADVLGLMFKDSEIDVLIALASNGNLDEAEQIVLAYKKDARIKQALMKNYNLYESVANILLRDDDWMVRHDIVQSKYVSVALVFSMLSDKDAEIRRLAKERLERDFGLIMSKE
jgi:hypothetical protein